MPFKNSNVPSVLPLSINKISKSLKYVCLEIESQKYFIEPISFFTLTPIAILSDDEYFWYLTNFKVWYSRIIEISEKYNYPNKLKYYRQVKKMVEKNR